MLDRGRPRSRILAGSIVVGLVLALVCAAPRLLRPAPADAQYFIPCPGGIAVPLGRSCPSVGGVVCNGVAVPNATSCGAAGGVSPVCRPSVSGFTTQPCVGAGGAACPGLGCPSGGTVVCQGGTMPASALCPAPTPRTGAAVNYRAGWNLVGGPAGTTLTGASQPMYTLSDDGSTYVTVDSSSALRPGVGYWAYFLAPAMVTLPPVSVGSVTLQLAPGQSMMIGNPENVPATVSGAGASLSVYDPTANSYQQAQLLAPGQGAWVVSDSGGLITISGVPTAPTVP